MLLNSHQRFGAAAVAATGGIRNAKPVSMLSKNASGSKTLSSMESSKSGLSARYDSYTDTKTSHTSTVRSSAQSSSKNSFNEGVGASTSAPSEDASARSTENETGGSSAAESNHTSSVAGQEKDAVRDETVSSSDPAQSLEQKPPSNDDIVIHVCDEARKVNRDFTCSKKLLLQEMKYFESYLSTSNQYDDIDISVHCDVYIFEWLMRFINQRNDPPLLKCKSAVSILISSEFLQMQRLVDQCLRYVHDNINDVIKLPIDLACINSGLVSRLSSLFTVEELEQIEDHRDKLKGKLWMKRVESLLEKPGNVLTCCSECGKVYCRRFQKHLSCPQAKPSIDFHGDVISRHVPLNSSQWKMRQYIHTLRSKQKVPWESLYWRLWGMFHMFHCSICGDAFSACEYNHCVYHPEAAKFGNGQNKGTYPCCGQEALRFDTTMRKSGCKARNHTVATAITAPSSPTNDSEWVREGFKAGNGIVGVRLGHNISPKRGADVHEVENTNTLVNILISHLDSAARPFVANARFGGYEEDRLAGMMGANSGASEKSKVEAKKSKNTSNKDTSSRSYSKNSSRSRSGFGSTSIPRRPGSSKGRRTSRPSTAGSGHDSSRSKSSSPFPNQAAGSALSNGIVGYNANSAGPDRMGQAGGISMSMAGKAVITPEAFRVNPQRRSMWKLDLQREEDVVRMQALFQKLEKMRGSSEFDECKW